MARSNQLNGTSIGLAIEIASKHYTKLSASLLLPHTARLLGLIQNGREEQQPYVRGTRVKEEMRIDDDEAALDLQPSLCHRTSGGGDETGDLSNGGQLAGDDARQLRVARSR